MEFLTTAGVVTVLSSGIVMLLTGSGKDPAILRLVIYGHQSLTLPFLFFIAKPKMRNFFFAEAKRLLDFEHLHVRNTKVHPRPEMLK